MSTPSSGGPTDPGLDDGNTRRLRPDGQGVAPGQTHREEDPAPTPAWFVDPFLRGVPGYEMLGVLGRGGMGIVYKARHLKLDRIVAVKGVRVETADARERFRLEARAVAALQHPGIVQIFEVGEHCGQPYYAMEYVPGGSLADRMARTADSPAPWRQDRRVAARLVEQLARAIHHAHTRGIIHRDLKPSNVLLDADDRPRVADFGLVKWVEDEPERAGRTETGVILGTPCYMAPEQALGRAAAVGPAADIYALGALLYHLLAGRPPFAAGSSLESLILSHSSEPVAPSRLIASCPRDLETICLKCMEKDPVLRYGSAGELADDLGRFLAGLPVHARPLGPVGLILKWARRHPAIAALSAAVTLSLAICFVLLVVWWREAERANRHWHALAREEQRGRETALLAVAEQRRQRERTERHLYSHLLASAEREWLLGDAPRARYFLDHCPESLRRWEWAHLRRRFEGSLQTLQAPGGGVSAVAYSPGRESLLVTAGGDGIVRFWEGGREVAHVRGADGPVQALAFSPDGLRLASAGPEGVVRLLDVKTRRELRVIRAQEGSAVAVAFSPDGRRLAVGARGFGNDALPQEARVFDAETGARLFVCKGHQGTVFAVDFAPDGKRLATGGYDRTVRLWDAVTGKELAIIGGHKELVAAVAFSPDGSRIASASFDHSVRLWDARTTQLVRTLTGHRQPIPSLAFSPDSNWLATASWDATVRLWDVSTGSTVAVHQGHLAPIHAVAFSPDGLRLASAARTGEVKVWETEAKPEPITFTGGRDWVPAAVFSPDGRLLASAHAGESIALWDIRNQLPRQGARPMHLWKAHREDTYALAFTADGALISVGSDGDLKIWNVPEGTLRQEWKAHKQGVRAVTVAPGGTLATGSAGGEVRLWDRKGSLLRELIGHTEEITGLAFSPDGSQMVTSSLDGTARVWGVETGAAQVVFRNHGSRVHRVAFSPDGAWVASSSGDRDRSKAPCDVRIWNAATGEERLVMSDDSVVFWCLTFSPDGTRIVTGNEAGVVTLWDLNDGEEILSLVGHERDDLRWLAFSPDGNVLASAGDDQQILLWDATPVASPPPR